MKPHSQGTNIVLIGDFNPAIFQPSWFASYDLLKREEAEAAKVTIIHHDISIFQTEWLTINVVRDKFTAATEQESYYEIVKDLVVSILGLLSHTPVKLMGINRFFHFPLLKEKNWHSLGHRLAPKEDWKDILIEPGMANVSVRGKRPDGRDGYVLVRVQPSAKIEFGVFIDVNDHYELAKDDKIGGGNGKAREILMGSFKESIDRSLKIAENIAKLGEG